MYLLLVLPNALGFSVPLTRPRLTQLNAVGIFYSTTTGNTETVAGYIQEAAGASEILDIGSVSDDTFMKYDGFIVGAPTWHTGADEQRSGTSWDDWLYGNLKNMDLKGKKVAVFGVGDQGSYSDNFCDAAGELYDCFADQGAELIGATGTDGYDFTDSKAVRGGKFCGLMCDEDNQFDLSQSRATEWVAQLKGEGMPF